MVLLPITNEYAEKPQLFLSSPFGETMLEQQTGVYENPYKFNAKELDSETGLYYYGARYYNPRISTWYGVDPLAEKMPSWSPYVYTLDNPVRFTDPDGKEPKDINIYYLGSDGKMHTYDYKYGASYTGKNKYLIAFHKAANALISSGAGGNLKGLEDSKETITVRGDQITMDQSVYFDYKTNNIHWLPTQGLDVDGDGEGELTPTAILDHEMDHGLEFLTNPKQFFKNLNTPDKKYDNLEEKRAITGDEQKTARKLRLITGKQKTRDNHNEGFLFQTAGVNTAKRKAQEIKEVIITIKKKK